MQLVISWFVGCTSGIHDVTFVPGAIPGTGQVTFRTRADGEAVVRHGLAGEPLDVESAGAPAEGGVVPVLGLPTTRTIELQVVVGDRESKVIEVTVPPPPQGVPILRLADPADPGGTCGDGYILFSYIGDTGSGVAIVDRHGNYVWAVKEEDATLQVGRARPGRDGKSILWNIAETEKCNDVATVIRQPLDGSERTVTRTLNGHHDFVELPDGQIGWLGYDMRPWTSPTGDERLVAADTIYETAEGTSDPEAYDVVFDTWEDYPSGVDAIPPDSIEQKFLCPRGEPEWGEPAFEFGHGNSLVYRESDDSYFMMWRWLDTLIQVDRTNPEDPYVRELGGANGSPPDSGGPFEHAHTSDVWDGGMLLFDNRHPEVVSRLVEYSLDDAGYQQVWESPGEEWEKLLGDVRRIPVEGCDNLLVSWSGQGRISEITRSGDTVWDLTTVGTNNITSRIYHLPDLYDFGAVAYP